MQSNYNPEGVNKMDNITTDLGNIANIADTAEVATANSPCMTQLETQVKELSLALAAASASSSNEKAACNMVMEEHLQRQKLEDSRTLNWQREEQAKMEEETERIRADAKRTIDINLMQHQQMAMQQKLLMESDAKEYLRTEVQTTH